MILRQVAEAVAVVTFLGNCYCLYSYPNLIMEKETVQLLLVEQYLTDKKRKYAAINTRAQSLNASDRKTRSTTYLFYQQQSIEHRQKTDPFLP